MGSLLLCFHVIAICHRLLKTFACYSSLSCCRLVKVEGKYGIEVKSDALTRSLLKTALRNIRAYPASSPGD